ncbi:MAG: hypothetical protein IKR25_08285 [Muribaculaceae bacterium]|nr:hypothetical protein [Muribaculaceae bacterium]
MLFDLSNPIATPFVTIQSRKVTPSFLNMQILQTFKLQPKPPKSRKFATEPPHRRTNADISSMKKQKLIADFAIGQEAVTRLRARRRMKNNKVL